jgi:hypothetical protein
VAEENEDVIPRQILLEVAVIASGNGFTVVGSVLKQPFARV